MKKTEYVLYTDPAGKQHDALISALNGLHDGFATIIYIDQDASESDNVKKIFDVPHTSIAPQLSARFLGGDEPVPPAPLPSAEDLDAVEEEKKTAEATAGSEVAPPAPTDAPAEAAPAGKIRMVKGSQAKS